MEAFDIIVKLGADFVEDELSLGDLLLGVQRIKVLALEEGRQENKQYVANLQARIAELEKELAARPLPRPTISIASADLFVKFKEGNMRDMFISYVKWVRNEAVKMSDGECIGLYEAKFIAEAVYAMYGVKEYAMPIRGEQVACINDFCNRSMVVKNIEDLLHFNYPNYDIVMSNPYEVA